MKSPAINSREKLYFALLSGLFLFLFLLFFQPFGVNNYNAKETISPEFLLAIGLMCLVVILLVLLSEFLVSPHLQRYLQKGQLLCWILWSIWWLGSGVFLFYNYLGGWHDFHLSSYLGFLVNIAVLSIFPVGGLLLYLKIRELRSALDLNHAYTPEEMDAETLLRFIAENQKDHFTLPLKLLIFIASDDNYVSIHHLQDGRVIKTLFRKSLKSIQEEVTHPALLRCHRSYLINLSHLQRIQGNRNKLVVYLNHTAGAIPVSRQYAASVLALLSQSPQKS